LYKAEELCGLLIKPKINDIDLDVLQDYYRKFLNPFVGNWINCKIFSS